MEAGTTTTPPVTPGPAESGTVQGESGQGGVAQQGAERAKDAMGQARGKLREQVDQRSTQAGERIQSSASDVRTVGEELRKQGKEAPAKMADSAAARIEKVGGYMRDSDADRMINDIEDFGRRQPLALLAGGLVVGFALSRFLKASSSQRYERHYTPRQLPSAGVYGNGSPAVDVPAR